VDVRRDVLARNDHYAESNRALFVQHRIAALNLISSPGAGKTSLLEATIGQLKDQVPLAVVEGDLQTDRDAARIRRAGIPVHQINTGEGCHLDAHMVGHALDKLPLPDGGVVFIENVGNLVCPASFDLGESQRVVLLSVTEGDDKVEKYPVAFRDASVLVVNKVDLLEYVDFSLDRCREMARNLNPEVTIFEVSARHGTGMKEWCQWVQQQTT
jgi:hydrogenase nickel incorporation protein HypB